MNKFEKIREQYPRVTNSTLQKLYDEDWTKSKKYFPYMVKIWNWKMNSGLTYTTQQLVKTVKRFDELLPYISNKDIYSEEYNDVRDLVSQIQIAEEIRDEKTFVREEHVLVLEETDDYIFLVPLTHRGSLKYGSGTRWCTASKNDEGTFNRYHNSGYLTYLISKNDKITNRCEKVAFWSEDSSPLSGEVMVYNTIDAYINDEELYKGGWDASTIFRLLMMYRKNAFIDLKTKQAAVNVKKKLTLLQNFDFVSLQRDLQLLSDVKNSDYVDEMLGGSYQKIIDDFIKTIEKQKVKNG